MPLSRVLTTEKLNAVGGDKDSFTASISEDISSGSDKKSASIHANWSGVQNGYEYLIELQINGGEKIQIGRTSILKEGKVSYSFNLESVGIEYDSEIAQNGGYVVIVTALGHDYYTQSESTQTICTFDSITGSGDIIVNNNQSSNNAWGNIPSGAAA